jgi:hypothetical protein
MDHEERLLMAADMSSVHEFSVGEAPITGLRDY